MITDFSHLIHWNPGTVQLWNYQPNHKILTLRLTRPDRQGSLDIVCKGLVDIKCQASWNNGQLEIRENCSGWVIEDPKAYCYIETEEVRTIEVPASETSINCGCQCGAPYQSSTLFYDGKSYCLECELAGKWKKG